MAAGDQGSPDAGLYSAAEVRFLLALTEKQAEELSEGFVDSIGHLPDPEEDSGARGAGDDDVPVPLIARWHDVQAALETARHVEPDGVWYMRLNVRGETQRDIATRFEISQATVSRHTRQALRLVLDLLGGEAAPAPLVLDRPTLCLSCGRRPRARLQAKLVRRKGEGLVVSQPERQLGVCAVCVAPELRDKLVGPGLRDASDEDLGDA